MLYRNMNAPCVRMRRWCGVAVVGTQRCCCCPRPIRISLACTTFIHLHLPPLPPSKELAADTGSGHNVVATCYMQSSSAGWLRRAAVDPSVPAAAAVAAATAGRVVGESEVAQGLASMAETGKYGPALVNAGIVGTVDLEAGPDVVRAVVAEHRRAARNFRGVRFRGGKAETIDWTLPAVRGSVAALAELGASLDCNGPETHPLDFAGVLGGIADVAEANPTLTVIVDHCGGAMGPTCTHAVFLLPPNPPPATCPPARHP